eukprot:4223866-Amphidinium_carterae.1
MMLHQVNVLSSVMMHDSHQMDLIPNAMLHEAPTSAASASTHEAPATLDAGPPAEVLHSRM